MNRKAKQLWLLAGGNGAGKTSFYNTQLKSLGIPFINADILAKQLYPNQPETHSYQAATIAEPIRLSDYCYLLDNSRVDNPFQQILVIKKGIVTYKKEPLPNWVKLLLSE